MVEENNEKNKEEGEDFTELGNEEGEELDFEEETSGEQIKVPADYWETLQGWLEEKGVERDKEIICSRGTGREATNEFVLLKWYLGFPEVRLYEGSFTEWCAFPDNETGMGDEPR